MKKVFVSGCYDMLHSGHVAFFEEASSYGDLYVGIGSDKTIYELKARKTINNENERLYMIKALKSVKDAWVNRGGGILDFLDEITTLKPDIFFVNSDGHSSLKEELCKKTGIEYVVSKRKPHEGLPVRSTTALRGDCRIPYRIDLAGGWLDQPMVSTLCSGPVLTICIEPDYEFNDRSGMSTSSRKKAIELWQTNIPAGDKEQLGRTLFCYENPPGTQYVSGSQDALGITMPGLNRLVYSGEYWPSQIKSVLDDDVLTWLEKNIWMLPLYPRHDGYNVLADTNINEISVRKLSKSAEDCWDAILKKDLTKMGEAMINAFDAQIDMYPHMMSGDIRDLLENYKPVAKGWKISGAGGGGYFILLSEKPIENAIQIRIRRGSED